MHVLAIIGSPRKGHSYELVGQIGELLGQDGQTTVERVLLGAMDLKLCRGCYVCQSRGECFCPLEDDLTALVARMKAADGLLLVSPVYTGNVSAQMKNLMDRLAWAAHRPIFIGKPAMLVATASMASRDTLKALSWFRYTGLEVVARVGWPVWPSPRRDWRRSASDERKLQRAVHRFQHAMLHPARSLSLRQVIEFSLMKITADVEPEFFRADHDSHRDIDALGLGVARWKKLVGTVTYRVGLAWLRSRLEAKGRRGPALPARGGAP